MGDLVLQCGSQWGQLCLREGIWPCLETFLVLITQRGRGDEMAGWHH